MSMTTRELYFKAKYLADGLPIARLNFTFKDKEDIIQIFGGSLNISFHDDVEETLQKIELIEKTEGFMFWNNSPEGEKFYKDNWRVIGKCLSNMILNQK
jgi:hypothetical protein